MAARRQSNSKIGRIENAPMAINSKGNAKSLLPRPALASDIGLPYLVQSWSWRGGITAKSYAFRAAAKVLT
jgi:hypothetical protein